MKDLKTYKSFAVFIAILFAVSSCEQNKLDSKNRSFKNGYVSKKTFKFNFPTNFYGLWTNTYESNTNNYFSFCFKNDSIIFSRASNHESIALNNKYKNCKLFEESSDSCYRVKFVGLKDSTIYEFKIQKFDFSHEPVLTYSIYENGELVREHFTSLNLVLTRQTL